MTENDAAVTDANEASGRAKGGHARAEKLTAAQRREIAKKAAASRWAAQHGMPRATHTGDLKIGDTLIPCAVLEDGRRVLWQQGFIRALGRTGRARKSAVPDDPSDRSYELPMFLSADNLKPFITNDLIAAAKPIVFRPLVGGPMSVGYLAELLPHVCNAIMAAGDAKALKPVQLQSYERTKILIRGLALVGITALVDEATGYQEIRDRRALEAILDKFLRKEFAAWAKRFPDEFYEQIFRLKDWTWKGMSVNRPGVVGKYTNDLVYERLAPGILEELQRINPKNDRGRRKAAHHQWLTEDIGHPALAQHVYALIGFMRASESWDNFYRMVQRAFPKKNTQMLLAIVD